MTNYTQQMVNDAIQRIDSLTIDELEQEFKSFGLSATRKEYGEPIPISDCLDDPDIQDFIRQLKEGKISVCTDPKGTYKPWTEQEKQI